MGRLNRLDPKQRRHLRRAKPPGSRLSGLEFRNPRFSAGCAVTGGVSGSGSGSGEVGEPAKNLEEPRLSVRKGRTSRVARAGGKR